MKKKLSVLVLASVLVFVFTAFQGVYAANVSIGTATDGNEVKIEKAALDLYKAQKAGKYKLVGTDTLKKWVDKKYSMVIVDTMPASSWTANRVVGAKNAEAPVKANEFTTAQKKALLKAVGKNKKKRVVIYCGFTLCPRSDVAAAYLVKKGYKKVYRYPGGIAAWLTAGYPIEGTAAEAAQ